LQLLILCTEHPGLLAKKVYFSMAQADLLIKRQTQAAHGFIWLLFQVFKEYPANFFDGLRFRLG
jgi:hypothetical protein